MRQMWSSSAVSLESRVRRDNDDEFRAIQGCWDRVFLNEPRLSAAPPITSGIGPRVRPVQAVSGKEVQFSRTVNVVTGQFDNGDDPGRFWRERGVPTDGEGQQMFQYFDIDAWQNNKNKSPVKRRRKG